MDLTLLGTGCPSVDLARHGPANLVDCGPGCRLLIDCGSGVTHRLLAAGCPGSEIDAVLLTLHLALKLTEQTRRHILLLDMHRDAGAIAMALGLKARVIKR